MKVSTPYRSGEGRHGDFWISLELSTVLFQSPTGIAIDSREAMEGLPKISISALDEALKRVHI
jgi:hypothetical protein